MAAADEPSSTDLEPFDYQRDVEPENEGAAPDRVTAMVRQYVQSTYTSMCVLAVILGGMFAFAILSSAQDLWRGVKPISVFWGMMAVIAFVGIPMVLLLFSVRAFRRFAITEEVLYLARGFRVQSWLLLTPLMLFVLFLAISFVLFL